MNKYSPTGVSFLTMVTQLGEELNTISVIKNYKNAQINLNSDSTAMELIRKFSAARKDLSEKQYSGTITPNIVISTTVVQTLTTGSTITED